MLSHLKANSLTSINSDLANDISIKFNKIKFLHFLIAFAILLAMLDIFALFGLSDVEIYPQINKNLFIAINEIFSHAPQFAHNLTQLGNACVLFAILLVFLLFAPKIFEAILPASLLSLILVHSLKRYYDMPRPALALDNSLFNIIGVKLDGENSFPSGHTTAIFCMLFVILIAFMPKRREFKVAFSTLITLLAILVGLSRAGVGAHYPIDILAGALIGTMCGIFGILVASKTRLFSWLNSSFGTLLFMIFAAYAEISLLSSISKFNLFVFYVALICAVIMLFFLARKLLQSSPPIAFIFIVALIQAIIFHAPFSLFINDNLELDSAKSFVLLISLKLCLFAILSLLPLIFGILSFKLSRFWLGLTFLTNALAVYFVATYGVFLDKNMMGNLFNTNFTEASEFLSFKMALFVVVLGVLPMIFVLFARLKTPTRKACAKFSALVFLSVIILAGINFSNLLWFDKHSKQLGALIMPYSYAINSLRFLQGEAAKNKEEILLPNAVIADNKKAVFVLVIGESARAANFSLYNYARETNPLLSKTPNLTHFTAKSSTTYTSASVKNMLSHKESGDLYEILPNYLARNGVGVAWFSSNWGEPPLHIKRILSHANLAQIYKDDGYELALISGLSEEIRALNATKTLIIIHTSTSHGPTYFKKYPSSFEKFLPACKSVEPKGCAQDEIINAYDNTILYTDFLLSEIIQQLRALKDYDSAMMYVSDHGESLGEKGVYMHGIPMAIAPKEQYEIPFILWSFNPCAIKNVSEASHFHIFHSVLAFLNVKSEIFDENMSLFEEIK